MRARDHQLERELGELAAKAAGFFDTHGLDSFADHRAHPGGVRESIDPVREMREEIADARNYACWGIEPLWEAYLAGDHDAGKRVAKLLDSLSHLIAAWHALAD